MSRDKGARGEREIKDLHNEFFITQKQSIRLERNQQQSLNGGYDLIGLTFLAIEIKLCEQFSLDNWWQQTMTQAKPGQYPVLFYRRNRIPWRVRMIGTVVDNMIDSPSMVIDIAIGDYFRWLATKLRGEKEYNANSQITP